MGRPKATLMIDGETMLDRQIRLLRSMASRVGVVGDSAEFSQQFGVPVVEDTVRDRGPLAGICAALQWTRTEFNLVLGCDLPFINGRLLGYLAARAIIDGSDVTVPLSQDGRLQPLCGVYRRQALHAVRASLAADRNKVSSFFSKVCCTVVPWRDLSGAGFRSVIFNDMNTPADYELARRRLEGPAATPA